MKTILKRYWFEFDCTEIKELPPGITFGCGITAYDDQDAISILQQKVFKDKEIPALKIQQKDVDIRTLDQRHVIPNMKAPTDRGVWFPIGYDF